MTSNDGLRERVRAFFEQYAPQDLHRVDKAAEYPVPEAELFALLRRKYNVVETNVVASTTTTSERTTTTTTSEGAGADHE